MRADGQDAGLGAAGERLDNRLLPVLREAVAGVQLVLFAALKKEYAKRYDLAVARRLAGCVVNDLFASPAADPEAVRFAGEQRDLVAAELQRLPATCSALLPHLTDALRMQVLCDHQQGRNSLSTLLRAQALGILQEERPLPLPSTFMLAVRQLGVEHGLLQPLPAGESLP